MWHPVPSAHDIPLWVTRQSTQLEFTRSGIPVQLELCKKQLPTCGAGVGRGLGVGVGRGASVAVGVAVAVAVAVALGLAVGVGVGAQVTSQPLGTTLFSTVFVSPLLPLYPATTRRLLPIAVPPVKECGTFVLGPAAQLSLRLS